MEVSAVQGAASARAAHKNCLPVIIVRGCVPAIDKWSSVVYETRHGLHSYTLTSGAPVLASIVRATLIGREQFGHFGNRGFILQTHSICSSLSEVTPVARKGSDVLTAGQMRAATEGQQLALRRGCRDADEVALDTTSPTPRKNWETLVGSLPQTLPPQPDWQTISPTLVD